MILVVGQYHSSLLSSLEARDIPYYTLKDAKRYRSPDAIDFSDATRVINHVKNLNVTPDCVFAMYEQYIPICAMINEALGVTHALSYDAALRCTDKVLMRDALAQTPNISPAYAEVTHKDQVFEFAEHYGFPLILKPANLSKSMLVSKCRDRHELEQALDQAFHDAPALYRKYTLDNEPKFIIEEFMEGSIHTVAAFTDSSGRVTIADGVVDNVSAQDIGFDDGFIFSRTLPSKLSDEQQRDIYECTQKGIAALGMRSCPAHAELILTSKGARIIEIGARLGGYRPQMYELALGVNLLDAAIMSYQGAQPQLTPRFHRACAVIELFPRHKGNLIAVEGYERAQRLPSLISYKVTKPIGEPIGRSADGYKATVIAVLAADDPGSLQHDIDTIRETTVVQVA